MARNQESHARTFSSSSKLPTLSQTAETRAAVLERLAADLRQQTDSDLHGCKRVADVFDALFNGRSAELDLDGLRTLRRLQVPQGLVPRRAVVTRSGRRAFAAGNARKGR
jgi:hypothetical protein